MKSVTERRMPRCALPMLLATIGWVGQPAAAAEPPGPSPKARAVLCAAAKAQQASYFDLWQREFQRRNKISAAEMAERVQPDTQEIFCGWVDGLAWRVDYTVSFGWARVRTHDELVLTLYSSTDAYRQHSLPRDRLWQPADIVRALDAEVSLAHIQALDLAAPPVFADEAQARAQLTQQLGGLTPQRSEFRLLPKNCTKPCTPGHPTLLGHAVVDEARNQCRSAEIDLLTGQGSVRDDPCRIS
ncbi:hypothetical protein [Ideonella sp.]|uniref:hypothetical protein n=1 Tax=Ideonella sp. TaxID=1929293 RepID=UPI0035AEA680